MGNAVDDKTYTVEEYFRLELKAERRYEFINGKLFEMPGEKDVNNLMTGWVYILLVNFLNHKGYQLFSHDIKVGIPGGKKCYYPDVFATREQRDINN